MKWDPKVNKKPAAPMKSDPDEKAAVEEKNDDEEQGEATEEEEETASLQLKLRSGHGNKMTIVVQSTSKDKTLKYLRSQALRWQARAYLRTTCARRLQSNCRCISRTLTLQLLEQIGWLHCDTMLEITRMRFWGAWGEMLGLCIADPQRHVAY